MPVAIATLSFAMLLAVGSVSVQFKVMHIENGLMSELLVDRDALRKNIDADLEEISKMDVSEFIQSSSFRFGKSAVQEQPSEEHALGLNYMRLVAPTIALQMIFNIAVMFVAAVFFLLLFAEGSKSAYETARRFPGKIFPMGGLILWMLVRSFVWIPLVGPIIAFFMLPRLALAPVFLVSGEVGIHQSLQLSMKRTSGRWFAVFLRLVLIAIAAFLILWPMLVITVGVSLFSLKIGFILLLLACIFSIAFQCASLTVLAARMA